MEDDKLHHSIIGHGILVLVLAEGFLGLAAGFFMLFSKNIYQISVVRKGHKVIGWALLASGFIECYYG